MTYALTFGTLIVSMLAACGGAQAGQTKRELLAVGSEVPSLVRVDHRGETVSLRSNTPTLLYFYPRDGTPGCTQEACALRDAWASYGRAGVRVVGVSTDTEEKHRAFAKEHDLPFSLIADPERVWSQALGVGSFLGLNERVSFLLDANRVAKVYEDVDPGVHAEQVLRDAEALHLTKP